MNATTAVILRAFLVLSVSVARVLAQAPGGQEQQPEFIKQGQQLMREGKLDAALALYSQTLQTSPNSLPANIAAGSVLDLLGQGEEARQHFGKQSKLSFDNSGSLFDYSRGFRFQFILEFTLTLLLYRLCVFVARRISISLIISYT